MLTAAASGRLLLISISEAGGPVTLAARCATGSPRCERLLACARRPCSPMSG